MSGASIGTDPDSAGPPGSAPTPDARPAIAIVDAHKAFDGRMALRGACLEVAFGEVHALLGENGAGKSTLMNLVCGLYAPDSGRIMIDGRPFTETDPRSAALRGIGMVHQHFKLIPSFTVAENMIVAGGAARAVGGRNGAAARIVALAAELGFAVDPHGLVRDLSVAERQRVEILRLLLLDARILILDEPTAVLTDTEADAVLALLRRLAADGRAVVLITHRLREVRRYGDRVTVMRGGKTVLAGAPCADYDRAKLARLMVGAEMAAVGARPAIRANDQVRLDVVDLTARRPDGGNALDRVSLRLHAGEILGIAGVGGNGQDALVETLYGLRPFDDGTLTLDGARIERAGIARRRAAGLRIIPADRNDFALIPAFRVYENLALTEIPAGRYGFWSGLRRGEMAKRARATMTERAVVGGGPRTPTRLLSGGNAQKLLLARELAGTGAGACVLIAHSPTRGLDVAACQAVHQALFDLVAAGGACLLVSEDLDEVLELSQRVAVLSRGRLFGPFAGDQIDRGRIGALMLGHA